MKVVDDICLVTGSWQLLMLTSALLTRDQSLKCSPRSVWLVIISKSGQLHLRDWLLAHAALLYPWSGIVVLHETDITLDPEVWPLPVKELTGRLRTAVDIDGARCIWLDYLPSFHQRLFLEAYPQASVIVYEDGLAAYHHYVAESHEVARRFSVWRSWRAVIKGTRQVQRQSHRLMTYKIPLEYEKRIESTWLFLGEYLRVPAVLNRSVMKIDPEIIREHMGRIRAVLPCEIPCAEGLNEVILLPQYFSAWGYMSAAVEQDLYEQVVGSIIQSGYQVAWKEHPRAEHPLGPVLEERFSSGFRALQMPRAVPVDVCMAGAGWVACVSGYSSSLYYARHFHQIPAYTFAHSALARMRNAGDSALQEVRNQFSDYRDLVRSPESV
jgi:hypothetical protein